MNIKNQKSNAKKFKDYWLGKGYEKGESQPFWLELLGNVFNVPEPAHYINFEEQVRLDHTSFIDGIIPKTHVLIEQKGAGKDLRKPIKQSDGTLLTPFQQAQRYSAVLPYSQRPRWIITCNFEEFLIYDMEKPSGEPESILLKDFDREYYRLNFLADTENENIKKEMEVSVKAGEIVGKIYDALLNQYKCPDENSLKSLNMLCVRLVFCLYAEDAGIFGTHSMFHDYLADIPVSGIRKALTELFKILDTKETDRDKYLADDNPKLASFPYVNGGLFANEDIEIPPFTDELKKLLLDRASADFDWSDISPTIFGAVFESTLNPETRRSGGMHYTSIENIHKVIDPLFLDELKEELAEIKEIKTPKTREKRADEFTQKISQLNFLDPACGSGNFLTETYMSLRRLENEALKITQTGGQIALNSGNVIKVSIRQFYGIEINDFAVTVAKTALWIAESQMMKETEEILHTNIDFLPLKSYANIAEGNALRLDWNSVIPKEGLNYIMGNPPFVGYSLQSRSQKEDILSIYTDENGKPYKTAGKIDYVSGWYKKAAEIMQNTNIKTAFVSTNSITQGEQTASVWKPLFERYGIQINFAHRTFKWNSEASEKAAVHCVIIGFCTNPVGATLCGRPHNLCKPMDGRTHRSAPTEQTPKYAVGADIIRPKYIYTDNRPIIAKNINAYLLDAPDIFVESRKKPLCVCPEIVKGFQATDNGFLTLNEKEKEELVKEEPNAEKWIRQYSMGVEFINNIPRFCLWLVNISPTELRSLPKVKQRVANCQKWRSEATITGDAYKLRNVPHLFRPCKQFKDEQYIAIPLVSSSNRKYMPMGFIKNGMIPGNNLFSIFGAGLYHFGVLTSNVHMAWIRAVGGQLKSDWRYSKDIVYNNFPWCNPTKEQRERIEQTAQEILNARALFPECSLADLYDEVAMPPELRKAHQANDKAVMQAYGFPVKNDFTESLCVAELMKMYQTLVNA